MPRSSVTGRPLRHSPLPRVLAALSLACACVAHAHPELEAALSRLNPLIAAQSGNAELYLERGELYAGHEDWVQAEANYQRAAELAPDLPRLARCLGTLAFKTGDYAAARTHFDRAVATDPADGEALILRSRVRSVLQDRTGALTDLESALARIANPRPELFLERAALLPDPRQAVASLDAAIARIGPALTLQLRALELEEAAGLTDAAVSRAIALSRQTERRDLWLKRAGDILARGGRPEDARSAYAAALAALETLPDWLRESPDVAALAADLRRHLSS